MKFAPYHRCSTRKQAGPGRSLLAEKARAAGEAMYEMAPGRLRRVTPFYGIEKGQITSPRPTLTEALSYAWSHGAGIVAADLSRIIRSDEFGPNNIEAVPRADEFQGLEELSKGIVIATLLPPETTEGERRSLATKRSGKAGREAKTDPMRILGLLGRKKKDGTYEHSFRKVAERCNSGKDAVARLLAKTVPDGSGRCWGDLDCPAEVYRQLCIADRRGT